MNADDTPATKGRPGLPPDVDQKPDPCVAELLTDVATLKTDNEAHKNALPLTKRVSTSWSRSRSGWPLSPKRSGQKDQLETSFGVMHTRIGDVDERAESAGLKADFAERKAVEVGQQVDQAGKRIAESAAAIEAGVDLPLKVGERPALIRSLLGFDRYRVTDASVTYVRRAGAPEEILAAVRAMAGDAVMTNDALRLELRQRVCGRSTNCETYVAWRGTVLRAARQQ